MHRFLITRQQLFMSMVVGGFLFAVLLMLAHNKGRVEGAAEMEAVMEDELAERVLRQQQEDTVADDSHDQCEQRLAKVEAAIKLLTIAQRLGMESRQATERKISQDLRRLVVYVDVLADRIEILMSEHRPTIKKVAGKSKVLKRGKDYPAHWETPYIYEIP